MKDSNDAHQIARNIDINTFSKKVAAIVLQATTGLHISFLGSSMEIGTIMAITAAKSSRDSSFPAGEKSLESQQAKRLMDVKP